MLERKWHVWLNADHFNTCFSLRLKSNNVDDVAFIVFYSEVVLCGFRGCSVLNFTDSCYCNFLAHFLFYFSDDFFDFRFVVVGDWDYFDLRCFGMNNFDFL